MKNNRTCFLLALLFILFLAAGCARPPAPAVKPALKPVDLGALRERTAYWSDYTAKFRMRIASPTGKTSSSALAIFKGPELARFESYALFGQTAALFVRNELESSVFIPSEKVIFISKRPEALIQHFLGISLPLEVFRYGLAGAIPPDQLENLQAFEDGPVWTASAQSQGQDRAFVWEFTPGMTGLKAAAVRDRGTQYRVEYDPPIAAAVDSAPKKITFSSPEWRMEIEIEQIRPNPQVSEQVFRLPPVSGARVAYLDKEQ